MTVLTPALRRASARSLFRHHSSPVARRPLSGTPPPPPPPSPCGCASRRQPAPAGPQTAYVALGSNMGDRVANIERACGEMDRRGVRVRRTSGLWETRPMYVEDQAMFLNGACEVETSLEPLALLDALQGIEQDMGRVKLVDKGPRNIDLDILLYGNIKVQHTRLTVPHIGIREREFVLRPLAQLMPGKPIDPQRPWEATQALLNAVLDSGDPAGLMSTMTPIGPSSQSITPMQPTRRTLVMGILNVTPDSFSDGGTHSAARPEELRASVEAMVAAGADMVDVGGQSTRPGADPVSPDDEMARVIPAIQLIRSLPSGKTIPISIDTYHSQVAEAAVAAGADVINDISAGVLDPAMLSTAARLGKTIILNHTRGSPKTMTRAENATYPLGVVAGVGEELLQRVRAAEEAGVRRWRIVLDPGLGFAKTGADNVELLRRLDELREWHGFEGIGWLVGPSRKKFVGRIVASEGRDDDDAGTAGAVAAAVAGGGDIVRVHNVGQMAKVVRMADAVWRYRTRSVE